jgi:hypothetical protein
MVEAEQSPAGGPPAVRLTGPGPMLDAGDRDLLRALAVLPDAALRRLQWHLQTGRPIVAEFGWADSPDEPAARGCPVGVTMSRRDYLGLVTSGEGHDLAELAEGAFPDWIGRYVRRVDEELSDTARSRLSEIVDAAIRRLP